MVEVVGHTSKRVLSFMKSKVEETTELMRSEELVAATKRLNEEKA
jgi:hypothetical protein